MKQLFGWTLYIAFLAVVVVIGWEQPLKVQLGLKPTAATPTVAPAPPAPSQSSWMNDSRRWDNTKGYVPPTAAPVTTPRTLP